MKAFLVKAGVGLVWFAGFSIVTNLAVRPLVRAIAAKAGVPQLGNIL